MSRIDPLDIDGRLSLWNFKDKLRTDGLGNTRDATSVGYVVGAGYKLTPDSNAMLQFEHDMNRLVGMRYRILAVVVARRALVESRSPGVRRVPGRCRSSQGCR